MEIRKTISDLRQSLVRHQQQRRTVGLVPTMGNLHRGHMALIKAAVVDCDIVVTSIFINPLQFGPDEDLASYPHTPDADIDLLQESGCHYLFMPSATEMYGKKTTDANSIVQVPCLSELYCGASRPGHFNGVTTVVSKLFNIVHPDIAYFGLKDYQQFVIIRQLVEDLCFPIKLVGIETVREASGLAMSSRNNYMDSQQRCIAASLYRTLRFMADQVKQGLYSISDLENQGLEQIMSIGMKPDYLSICNARTLEPANDETKDFAILAAAFIGSTRLIDNVRFQLDRSGEMLSKSGKSS